MVVNTAKSILKNVSPAKSLCDADKKVIAAIQNGLPLVPRPYAQIGERIGMNEQEVFERVNALRDSGVIKRMGVVVRHHELGYRSNAMVVWNVDDAKVDQLGSCIGNFDFVTLCYRRPRRLPDWPYNLFTMIHGKDRETVLESLDYLVERCSLQEIDHEVLFSLRRFKQRGANYLPTTAQEPDILSEMK